MAKALIMAAGPATPPQAYFPPAGGSTDVDTTESNWQLTVRVGGTLTNFSFYLINNTYANAGSGNVRKNGANGSGAISVPGSTAGLFEDLSGSDSFSSGDTLDYSVTPGSGGGSANVTVIGSTFAATTNTTSMLICGGKAVVFGTAGRTTFLPLGGDLHETVTGESPAQSRLSKAGTLANLFVSVNTNSRSDSTTVRSRVNGANGNLVASVGASTTGTFEDTTHSDTTSAGDSVNTSLTLGAGTGSLTATMVAVTFTTTTSAGELVHADASGGTFILNGATDYWSFSGAGNDTTEAHWQYPIRYAATLSNCWLNTQNNTYAGSSTINVRQNGGNTALTLSIAGGATGFFEDTSDTVSVSSGDLLNFQAVTSGTGALTEDGSGITITVPSGITPLDWNFARERPVHYGKFSLIDSGPMPGRGI